MPRRAADGDGAVVGQLEEARRTREQQSEHRGRQFVLFHTSSSSSLVRDWELGAADRGHRIVGMFLPAALPQPFLLEGVPGRLSLHQREPAGGKVTFTTTEIIDKAPSTQENLERPIARPRGSRAKDFPLQGRKEKQMDGDP